MNPLNIFYPLLPAADCQVGAHHSGMEGGGLNNCYLQHTPTPYSNYSDPTVPNTFWSLLGFFEGLLEGAMIGSHSLIPHKNQGTLNPEP